jgi:hypothetical protein
MMRRHARMTGGEPGATDTAGGMTETPRDAKPPRGRTTDARVRVIVPARRATDATRRTRDGAPG